MGFPVSHQPRLYVTLTSPKWCLDTQILGFFRRNSDQKPLKVCHKVSLCKHTSSSKVVAQSTILIEQYQHFGPVLVKFGPKGADPVKDCTFHVSHAARCAVSDSRPCVFRLVTQYDMKQ